MQLHGFHFILAAGVRKMEGPIWRTKTSNEVTSKIEGLHNRLIVF
jgi:hypothetical protein